MVRFAYSTNAYTRFSLWDALVEIQKCGFEGVEILADLPHAFPARFSKGQITALKEKIKENRLSISNLNGNTSLGLDPEGRDPDGFWPSLIDPDEENRAKRIEYVKSVIDLARTLGAPNICTASGKPTTDQAEGWLQNSFEQILHHAKKDPVIRVGIEYEPGFFLEDRKSTLKFLDQMNHPLLGVNLDIGHAICVGEDIRETVKAFQGRIWNIHVEDIQDRIHDHLIPGRGNLPFDTLRKALDEINYDRFLTLELYPYKESPSQAGKEGLEHLKPLFS